VSLIFSLCKPIDDEVHEQKEKLVEWAIHFGFAHMKCIVTKLDEWTRGRLRMCIWKRKLELRIPKPGNTKILEKAI
jgi:hypothetical protein